MGVHGLTTFVRNHSTLKEVVILPAVSAESTRIPFIIDGLAFLYQVGLIDTFRGGDYYQLRLLVAAYVLYWRACGLEPEIVFDGPSERSKSETILARSRQTMAKSIRYMRLTDDNRMNPGEISQAARLPLLSMGACVDAFVEEGVTIHFAEGEADSPTAELAERRNGYMASVDSDYFIFPSNCRGYVPLNQIQYGHERHIRPTFGGGHIELYMPVYHYRRTAAALEIEPEYLPVLAALLGNDHFSSPEVKTPSKSARPYPGYVNPKDTARIARALANVKSGLDTAGCIVTVLPQLIGPASDTGDLVTSLVDSAATYHLQPLGTLMPSFPFNPQLNDTPLQSACRLRFKLAFKRGRANMFLCTILKHRMIFASGALEDPTYQSTSIYIGRPIRLWIYAVLADSVGFRGDNVIHEYVRRNEDLRPEKIMIPRLENLLATVDLSPGPIPIVLAQPSVRLAVYLAALNWFHAPPDATTFLPLVLSLRHIQCTTKRPWSEDELAAACLTAVLLRSPDLMPETSSLNQRAPKKTWIHRSAELLQALWYTNLLAESLLLSGGADDYDSSSSTVSLPLPQVHTLFNGALLHLLFDTGHALAVARGSPPAVQLAFEEVWSMLCS